MFKNSRQKTKKGEVKRDKERERETESDVFGVKFP